MASVYFSIIFSSVDNISSLSLHFSISFSISSDSECVYMEGSPADSEEIRNMLLIPIRAFLILLI